ncbi:IS1-like element transposase [Escherichia coli]|uniref:IS1-like element transposase n=1 Tax=Escherichia coli TaxID=562 RepID=UPI003D9C5102
MRNGKSTAGHQRYLCSHCRKTWQLQFTYTASQPGTHQKIIDMAMNGVGCRATSSSARKWTNSGAMSGLNRASSPGCWDLNRRTRRCGVRRVTA